MRPKSGLVATAIVLAVCLAVLQQLMLYNLTQILCMLARLLVVFGNLLLEASNGNLFLIKNSPHLLELLLFNNQIRALYGQVQEKVIQEIVLMAVLAYTNLLMLEKHGKQWG